MAAVTVTAQRTNVDGSYRERFYTINIATSGDTMATPFRTIKGVSFNDVAITKAAAAVGVITFTTTGAVTGALVRVVGL
mgnify:CR=1 FL=1